MSQYNSAALPSRLCCRHPSFAPHLLSGQSVWRFLLAPQLYSNFSDHPSTKMTLFFPFCDYKHWLIVMEKPGSKGATKQ
ncbi:hypothetical protein D8674_005417 [Pyrus ussuriensis x Pyrus communis]|uniref:Uncharacterized protein n=1 Tax=Pyrus ussuriensis x Pyrus communis TaxID=2448454 RepID=A0A5N5FWE7_9ROSA|nr:hypothetical protein D8674_005417 [Pyrus ussuriensis x Pyrus communis]